MTLTKQHVTRAGRSKAAKARKLEHYDAVAAERDLLSLYFYDLDQEVEKEIKATGSGRPDTMARVINPPDNGL
jgi:hypothetical protein